MRVTHLVPALFGPSGIVGGAERYALELASAMADNLPTRLLTFGDHDAEYSHGRLSVSVLGKPYYVRGQRNNCLHQRMLLELSDADVIHCHQQNILTSSVAAMIARLGGRRVFVSNLGGGGWDISAYVSTVRWYHGHLHISEYSRKICGQEDDPRARVILGGVDLNRFVPPTGAVRRSGVVYVGRLLPHKGIDDLIEGLPAGVSLRVIGRPYDPDYFAVLRQLATGKPVTFEHNATDAQIIEAYQRAICVVLPSVYKTRYGAESAVPELLGQTLLEGMACGAATVCTDVASMPEVVCDGVTGFVVPPNDPAALRAVLTRLHDDCTLAESMGREGRRRAETIFNWARVVDRCIGAYKTL